jgi:hypothetical protein
MHFILHISIWIVGAGAYMPAWDPSAQSNQMPYQQGYSNPQPSQQDPYFMQNPQPSVNYQQQQLLNSQPVTSQEATTMDTKLSTIQSAVNLILTMRAHNSNPEMLSDPQIQYLYRMLRPVVQAADQVEQQNNQANQQPGMGSNQGQWQGQGYQPQYNQQPSQNYQQSPQNYQQNAQPMQYPIQPNMQYGF